MPSDRIVLHRCPVPTDVLCPCGKVARKLRRAGIQPDEVVRVPLSKRRRDGVYLLTGQRHVPVLEVGDSAVCDSRRIVEWIDQLAATRSASATGQTESGSASVS